MYTCMGMCFYHAHTLHYTNKRAEPSKYMLPFAWLNPGVGVA